MPETEGSSAVTPTAGDQADTAGHYDVLVLDATHKQSLASARSLGRAGLRVALAESYAEHRHGEPVPAFSSKYCHHAVELPNYAKDAAAYRDAVVDFVQAHGTRVVLPTGDGNIAAIAPSRKRLADLGCVLALASDATLEIACDKDRTLEIARTLDIAIPRSILVRNVAELPAVYAELGFPFVVKPTVSWTGRSDARLISRPGRQRGRGRQATEGALDAGADVLAQEWASGRREGVSLFIADGEVLAAVGHVAYRTSPPLGGVSILRESIAPPKDILTPATTFATEIGLEGAFEVEFRSNRAGRPLLMEINPRLTGTIENAVRSGVDFPLMIWQWATGSPCSGSPTTAPASGPAGSTATCAGCARTTCWRASGHGVQGPRTLAVRHRVRPDPLLRQRRRRDLAPALDGVARHGRRLPDPELTAHPDEHARLIGRTAPRLTPHNVTTPRIRAADDTLV